MKPNTLGPITYASWSCNPYKVHNIPFKRLTKMMGNGSESADLVLEEPEAGD